MKIKSSELTWYEDGNMIEWWENDSIKPENKKNDYYTLEEAIEIAKFNKLTLYVQPALQDENIMLDYSEKEQNMAETEYTSKELLDMKFSEILCLIAYNMDEEGTSKGDAGTLVFENDYYGFSVNVIKKEV